jgi:hypothetical protein
MQIVAFMKVIDGYCAAAGLAEATVSTRVFNDGKRITEVRAGADIGMRRVEKAIQWFSDNWPENTPWPEGVYRPVPTILEAAQ